MKIYTVMKWLSLQQNIAGVRGILGILGILGFIILLSFPNAQVLAKSRVTFLPEKNLELLKNKTTFCFGKNYKSFKKLSSQYDASIKKHGLANGISVALIKAIITAESCFNPNAVSPKGAQGLMQLIPDTAKRFGVADSFDPDANIRGGARYLKFLLKYFDDDLLDTIAAYNSGEGTVKKYKGIPPYKETRDYVSKVSILYRYFSEDTNKSIYKQFKIGKYPQTFFIPRAMPKSRFSPYKNRQRNIARGQCQNRTSTRIRQSTKVLSGNGVWQRVYTAKHGDTLQRVMNKTGVHKRKLMQMNGLSSRARLRQGQKILVWECRK